MARALVPNLSINTILLVVPTGMRLSTIVLCVFGAVVVLYGILCAKYPEHLACRATPARKTTRPNRLRRCGARPRAARRAAPFTRAAGS